MKIAKKSILTLAFLSTIPAQAYANELPSMNWYGLLNVGVQQSDYDTTNQAEVVSYASRFGVKGSSELSSDLNLIYQLEWQVDVADLGGSDNITSRNQFIGLQGNLGTFKLGRLETATKFTQGGYDIFGDFSGDISGVLAGKFDLSDSISYSSINVNGFQFHANYIFSETDGVSDGKSAALTYGDAGLTNQAFFVAAAFDRDVADFDIDRIVGYGLIGDTRIGVLVQQQTDLLTGAEGDGFSVNLTKPVGKFDLKTQYQALDLDQGTNSSWSFGADYRLTEKTTAYAWFTDVDKEVIDSQEQFFAVGLIHRF